MSRVAEWIYSRVMGWKAEPEDLAGTGDVSGKSRLSPLPEKCVICLAPHTSNTDFFICYLYSLAIGVRIHFLMKKEWFFPPLNVILKWLGGIPVDRGKSSGLTAELARSIIRSRRFVLAITPEGTRSANKDWHWGFYHIAVRARVPVLLFVLDYKNKRIYCRKRIMPSADARAGCALIRNYYKPLHYAAKYPEKFEV